MKKYSIFFSILLLCVVLFSACSKPTPEEVTQSFIEALLVEDYKKMHDLSTEEEQKKYAPEMLQEGAKMRNKEKIKRLEYMNTCTYSYEQIAAESDSTDFTKVTIYYVDPDSTKNQLTLQLKLEDEIWKMDGFGKVEI